MRDVTAVILTIGEATTQRAIESVKSQSKQPYDIMVISHVSPFYRAMIQAIEKVRSPFFVQVDADMILDKWCFAELRKCMEPKVGLVVGHLRDPLVQRVVGIKMYRTASFQHITFKDSISPDTDVGKELMSHGWDTIYALNYSQPESRWWHCFGEHQPEYTPFYTFSKSLLEGKRYRYRGTVNAFMGHLGRLQKANTDIAIFAQVALAHGLFSTESGDELKPFASNDEWEHFESFIQSSPTFRLSLLSIFTSFVRGKFHPFEAFYRLGVAIRDANARGTFFQIMKVLSHFHIHIVLIPMVALSHGVVSQQKDDEYPSYAKNLFYKFQARQKLFSVIQFLAERNSFFRYLYKTIRLMRKLHSTISPNTKG